jgi:methylthioribose-1-phosphate isomerase
MNLPTLHDFTAHRRPIIAGERCIYLLDQTLLPHAVGVLTVADGDAAAHAIRSMQIRGAPLIGAVAAFGLALYLAGEGASRLSHGDSLRSSHGDSLRSPHRGSFQSQKNADNAALDRAFDTLAATRPTAINLLWALQRVRDKVAPLPPDQRAERAWAEALAILDEDIAQNRAIGRCGLAALKTHGRADRPLQLMTHCNAGWLATGGEGTALSPIYAAQAAGVPIHVWVSETRPRNQGLLTEWELRQAGIPHTYLADNAAGLLLAQGMIDAVIVGADRIAANGDVANKIGTYLKALACADNGVPFYVAAPGSTFDFACPEGAAIPIEQRNGAEIRSIVGAAGPAKILPTPVAVSNYGFDVTPARLVKGIATERGVIAASRDALAATFPERAA